MPLSLTTFKTTNPTYFPLVGGKPAWKLDYSGNGYDALLDYLVANCGTLNDPGSNGIVMRTALNTTVAAVAGTDYQAAIVNPSWTAPTFNPSLGTPWANFGSGLTVAGYCKNAVGELLLRGALAAGTLGSGYVQIFSALPSGFRPASDRYGIVIGFIGGSTPTPLPIKVDTSGGVSLFNTSFASPSLVEIDSRFPLF